MAKETFVAGISYLPRILVSDHRYVLDLRFASAICNLVNVALVRSERWLCRLPDPDEYVEELSTVSETRGIVGGVPQRILAAQSEAIERAISDAVTICFSQILDLNADVGLFLIPGPALPKTLGRLLSFRPEEDTTIAWISRNAERTDQLTSPFSWQLTRAMAWEPEGLLNSFTYPDHRPQWTIEFADLGESVKRAQLVTSTLESRSLVRGTTPRQLMFPQDMLLPDKEPRYLPTGGGLPKWALERLPDYVINPARDREEHRGLVLLTWVNG